MSDFTERLRNPPSLLTLVSLTTVWVFLWGDFSIGNLLAGLALAWFVVLAAPLPRTSKRRYAFRPTAVVRLVLRFLVDVVTASCQISWFTLRNCQPVEAVIRVRLHAHSDVFLTATAGMVSLIPGSIVVDVHRLTGTLYIHIFDIDLAGGLDRAYRSAIRQEELLLRAFGSKDELREAGYRPGAFPSLGRLMSEERSLAGDS